MYERILVPLDGSELAEVPLNYAKELATRARAEVVLLHVCGPEECYCGPEECRIEPMHRVYIEHTTEVLRGRLQEAGAEGAKVGAAILAGDPAHEILGYAEKNHASLIVMATHGRSGMRRWVIGSVADKVIRYSYAPVRLVRSLRSEETVPEDWPERSILVLLDGSELAEQVLPYVVDHARMGDAEVVLLRVCEPPIISSDYPEASMPLSWEEHVEQVTAHRQHQCSLYLGDAERKLKDMGIKVKSESLLGNAIEEIISYIERNRFNLVAMTTHGRSGLRRWAYGRVADKVLQASPSPLLLIRVH